MDNVTPDTQGSAPIRCCASDCCGEDAPRVIGNPERPALTRGDFRLEWLTVAWMVVEAVVAVASGIAAGSVLLLACGLDSVIQLASAGVLIWRLSVELRRGQEFSENAERLASRIGGGLLFALAIYVVTSAAWSLWTRYGAEFSADCAEPIGSENGTRASSIMAGVAVSNSAGNWLRHPSLCFRSDVLCYIRQRIPDLRQTRTG